MYLKKCMAVLLSAALALCLLTGCGTKYYSDEIIAALNAVQSGSVRIVFEDDSALNRALKKALNKGSDAQSILDALLDELELDSVDFTANGIASAQKGSHGIKVYVMEGEDPAQAAADVANLLKDLLNRLGSSGKYTGQASMMEIANGYLVAVDIAVVESGTASGGSGGGSNSPEIDGEIGGGDGSDWEDGSTGGGGTETGGGGTETGEGGTGGEEKIEVTIPPEPTVGTYNPISPITATDEKVRVFTSGFLFKESFEASGLNSVLNKQPYDNETTFQFINGGSLSTRLSDALKKLAGGNDKTYERLLELIEAEDTSRQNSVLWKRVPVEQLEYSVKYEQADSHIPNYYAFVVVEDEFTLNDKKGLGELDQRAMQELCEKLKGIIDPYTSSGTGIDEETHQANGKDFYYLKKNGEVFYDNGKPRVHRIVYTPGYQEIGLVRVKESEDQYHYYAAVCLVVNTKDVP